MAMNSEFDREVTFEITEQIGVIASYPTGWKKELNLVSWNGGTPKYDIRDWDPEHEHMSRGVTLHEKEMRLILDLLRKRRQQRSYRRSDAAGGYGCSAGQPPTAAGMDAEAGGAPLQDEEQIAEATRVMEAIAGEKPAEDS